MKRREFITLLGGAGIWPLAASAQQPALPVVGWLGTRADSDDPHLLVAFRQGLADTGHIEGRNVAIEYRWADHHNDRLPALAADLVRRQVSVIVAAGGPPPALAAKAATSTIPIVFNMGTDPVALGLVASLNRPGGNLTGSSSLNVELGPKRLELLRELLPTATSIALLVNPTNQNAEALSRGLQSAARTLGLQLPLLQATSASDLDAAFESLAQLRANALVIGSDGFFIGRAERLAALALRQRVPTIFQTREFAAAGGLMSYGGNIADEYRLMGAYAGRILKGEKPADLPVQQITKVELIINMKTAKALGLTVPPMLRALADEVIE